ncbi:HEAT repeat domain-containing protein [Paraburkholderia bengalensis]|uniref:HEAT repeat domain-containing protein n=1 Tax=Paraburkholderia bengalensis TaxID=2747562 RepID=A0ABU8IRR4_9BURK
MRKEASSGAVLSEWIDHPEPFLQAAVLRALRELRYADAFSPAVRALDHDDPKVRIEAVGMLGWLKDARALAPLAAIAAHDANADIRRAAVGALGFAPANDVATTAALRHALADAAWPVGLSGATAGHALTLAHVTSRHI